MALISVKAESNLNRVLAEIEAQGRSIDRALPIIAEMVVGAVHDVFDAEGPGWEPLKESTLERRRGTTHKILQDTGVFANSVAPKYGPTYAEAVDGTSYGHFHVTGTARMARRDPFELGPFEAPLLEDVAELLAGQF